MNEDTGSAARSGSSYLSVSPYLRTGPHPIYVDTRARLQTVFESLREGKDVNQVRDETGRTALHMAAECGDMDMVDLLIQQYGACTAAETNRKYTALHLAAMNGRTDVVEALLRKEADATAENADGLNPLDMALVGQHLEDGDCDGSALVLLERMTEQQVLQQKDKFKLPLLWRAAMRGHVRTTEWILEHPTMDAVELLSEPLHGRTLLFEALAKHHQEVIMLLLKHDARVQGVSSGGDTGLHYAASAGMSEVVKHLLRTDRHHEPPSSKALEMQNLLGRSPLESACYSCKFDQDLGVTRQDEYRDIISLLLEKTDPSLPTAEDTQKWTALHWTAYYKRPDLIRILVSLGADVEARDLKHRRPSDIAKLGVPCKKVTEIMEWLQPLAESIEIRGREVHGEHPLTRPRPVDDCDPLLCRIPVYLAAVYRGGSCQTSGFSVRSTLYQGGPRALLKAMGKRGGSRLGRDEIGDLALQWVHLPANNKMWIKSLDSESCDKPFTQERRDGEIKGSVSLLREIKNVLHELFIIRAVLSSQNSVISDASNFLNRTFRHKSDNSDIGGDEEKFESVLELTHHYWAYSKLDLTMSQVNKLISEAIQVRDNIDQLLDLRQKHANLAEAIWARKASESATLQGRTIMVFTVVTIIFLPITFLSSLFALDISIFPHNDDGDLSYTPGWAFSWMFGMTAAVSAPLILIAFFVNQISDYLSHLNPRKPNRSIPAGVSEEAREEFGYADESQLVNGEPNGAMKTSKEGQGGWKSVFRLRTVKQEAGPAV